VFRDATAEDIAAFASDRFRPTVRAKVAELDGRIIAIAGLCRKDARWFAFCDLKAEMRRHKIALARAVRRGLAEAASVLGVTFIYAERDMQEPTSGRWLESLGFEVDPRSQTLYRWKRGG
jgi:hypothetical protein